MEYWNPGMGYCNNMEYLIGMEWNTGLALLVDFAVIVAAIRLVNR